MSNEPTAAILEIIERGARTGDQSSGESVIVPNDVRINGHRLLTSADHPVVVNEVTSGADDTVYATLTLLARRVVIGAEEDVAPVLLGAEPTGTWVARDALGETVYPFATEVDALRFANEEGFLKVVFVPWGEDVARYTAPAPSS